MPHSTRIIGRLIPFWCVYGSNANCLVGVFVLQDKMHAELLIKVLNVNTRSGTAKRWLAQWLLLMRHIPPNVDSVNAQISKISPDVLFAQYALLLSRLVKCLCSSKVFLDFSR
jgi:hypothetical protein